MVHSEAEDAGGLSPAKDDNEAMRHFIRRTLPILDCVDYKSGYSFVTAFNMVPVSSAKSSFIAEMPRSIPIKYNYSCYSAASCIRFGPLHKDIKQIVADLKKINTAVTLDKAKENLLSFGERWRGQY